MVCVSCFVYQMLIFRVAHRAANLNACNDNNNNGTNNNNNQNQKRKRRRGTKKKGIFFFERNEKKCENTEIRKVKRHSYELMLSLRNNWDSEFFPAVFCAHLLRIRPTYSAIAIVHPYSCIGRAMISTFLCCIHRHTRQQTRQLNFHIKPSTFSPFPFTLAPVASRNERHDEGKSVDKKKSNALAVADAVCASPRTAFRTF